MKTILANSPHESSFSFSRRYFNLKKKFTTSEEEYNDQLTLNTSFSYDPEDEPEYPVPNSIIPFQAPPKPKKLPKIFHIFTHPTKHNRTRGFGTLFGNRRGHVRFAFQSDPKRNPELLIQLATPTSILVREMASGLVRIALECDKIKTRGRNRKLVEEQAWRSYCNGRRCGYALRRQCGEEEVKVLRALEVITMGAGVLPEEEKDDTVSSCEVGVGEVMYMRARFERVVGSKDSEAFYMVSPDGNGGPELSVYLLRS